MNEATRVSILALGGDEELVSQLARVPSSDKNGGPVLIASFEDGRLLRPQQAPALT